MDNHGKSSAAGDESDSSLPVPRQGGRALVAHQAPEQALGAFRGQPDATPPPDDEIDLVKYWRILAKRKWMILAIMAFALGWAQVKVLLETKIYRASATIAIESKLIQVVAMGETDGGTWGERGRFETELEMLKSRSLAQRVAADLGLMRPSDLRHMDTPSTWQKFQELLGLKPVEDMAGNPAESAEPLVEDLDAGEGDPQSSPVRERDPVSDSLRVASMISGGLSVSPVGHSSLVRLTFDSPNPDLSKRIVNGFAESYVKSNLDRRVDTSSYAKTFLEGQIKELKVKLEESERALVAFAQQEQIVGGVAGDSLTDQNLSSINSALSSARSERLRAETRWRQAQASTGTVVAGLIGEKSIIQSLQQTRSTLMSDYQNKLALFKPNYPTMLELQSQIEELDRQIVAEVGSIKDAIRAEYDAALAQEETLVQMLEGMKAEVLDLQKRSINYTILKREVDTNRELYDGLLQRYKEIDVASNVSNNNVSVVDRAVSAHQIAPVARRIIMMALVIGLILGVLIALALEFMDDTVKGPEDVEGKLKLVHLGVVPKLEKGETPKTAMQDLRSGFSEAYRSIRTALQFSTESGVPAVLAVTSTMPGEGKTTTAMALAMNLAQLGKRVLLIDADLRNPSIHKLMELENARGLSNYLSGAMKPGECIQKLEDSGLSVLCSGPLPPNPAELLAGPRMLSLLTRAMERFDQIIIDAPPVVGLADAPIISNLAHGTVLVVEAGRARVGAIDVSIKRLHAARARLLGAILTKFDSRTTTYGYGSYSYMSTSYMSYDYQADDRKPARGLLGRR